MQGVKTVQCLIGTVDKEFTLLQMLELPFEPYLARVSGTREKKKK